MPPKFGGFGKPGGFGGGFGAKPAMSLSALKAQAKEKEEKEKELAKEETATAAAAAAADPTAAKQEEGQSGWRNSCGTGQIDPNKKTEAAEKLEVGAGAYQVFSARAGLSDLEKRMKGINGTLNKFAPEKYDILCERLVKEHEVLGEEAVLEGTVPLIFKRAVAQPDLCHLFADLCAYLTRQLEQTSLQRAKDFKKLLLNAVQGEYEKMKEVGEDIPKVRRMGISQFVGDLYCHGLLNARIMVLILSDLLYGQTSPPENAATVAPSPSETSAEVLCKLLGTVGSTLDEDEAVGKPFIAVYLNSLLKLSTAASYGPRLRFLFLGTAQLKEKGWVCPPPPLFCDSSTLSLSPRLAVDEYCNMTTRASTPTPSPQPDTNAKAKTISDQERQEQEREEERYVPRCNQASSIQHACVIAASH